MSRIVHAPCRRSVGAASAAAEGRCRHRARPRRGSAQEHRQQQEPDGERIAAGHVDVYRDEPGDAGTGQAAGAPGDQVGDRLRRDREEHHAGHLERLPGIPARCAARRAEGQPVPQGRREGEAAAGRGRAGGRVRGEHGLHFAVAVRRYRAGDPGGPRGDRHQGAAAARRAEAGDHQDPRAAAPVGDAGVGHRLLRPQLERAGVVREPRRFRCRAS